MTTKQALLQYLLSRPDQPLSGQALADKLGVSRMAVSKACRELQKQGWQIEAASGRGYRLCSGSDALTGDAVLSAWAQQSDTPYPGQVRVFSTLPSSNRTAKEWAMAGAPHGSLVLAGEQTEGRGRRGRTFVSPAGKGVYFSLILRPEVGAAASLAVTGSAAVAVCRAVQKLCGIELSIKWVNDLYYKGKKVCGILTEATTDLESGHTEWLVVGIGLNLTASPADFGAELSGIASSLYPDGSSPVSRAALVAAICRELLSLCPEFDYLPEYRQRCFVPGHWITVYGSGEPWSAKAIAIDDNGRLLVEVGGRQIAIDHGEVSIKPAQTE